MTALLNACAFIPSAGSTTDWTYSAAVSGYNSPAQAGVVDGETYCYRAESSDLTQWEIGTGTYTTSTGVLTRSTVLYNSSGTGTAAGQSGAGTKINFSAAPRVAITATSIELGREVLTDNKIFYVGHVVGSPTISIASPAVATLNSHGLNNGDRVAFSVLPFTQTVTLSTASPCVATTPSDHGFAAGRPIKFSSTGWLPSGVVADTTYYVISTGLTSTQFQFSATVGGSAVNSAALNNTFTSGNSTVTVSAAHNLVVGQIIRFSGTSVVNVSNATDYYVLSTPASTTFTFAATGSGTAITPGTVTTQGTFVQNGTHYVESVGALPTGITAGTTYYVINKATNTFQISTTAGGSAVNTSGSVTGTPVYSVRTGSDSNSGLANTSANAWWTLQAAYDYIVSNLDQSIYTAYIYLADGTYTEGLSASQPPTGKIFINGNPNNTPYLDNVTISKSGSYSSCFYFILNYYGPEISIAGLKMTNSNGNCINGYSFANVVYYEVNFGACNTYHIYMQSGSRAFGISNYRITGGAAAHSYAETNSYIEYPSVQTISITNVPAFSVRFASAISQSRISAYLTIFIGGTTGTRYVSDTQSYINTFGSGVNYFPGTTAGSAESANYALYS